MQLGIVDHPTNVHRLAVVPDAFCIRIETVLKKRKPPQKILDCELKKPTRTNGQGEVSMLRVLFDCMVQI